MKQTAVEWYNSEVIELMTQREQGNIDVLEFRNQLDLLFEQAKQMEKKQMKIYEIDKGIFDRLPIEGKNYCSFRVNEFRYFATKYYIDNFKETFKSK